MSNPFNIGPQSGERNPPITADYYSPQLAVISSISSISQFATQVVTTEENEFVVGQIVRFIIPARDGMVQLNERQAIVTSITNSTTFIVDIDTTKMGTFNASTNTFQDPFVVPVGDINSGAINSSGRINNLLYISGSFKNIGPV